MRLAESLGVVGGPGSTLDVVNAPIDEQVATVHTAELIEAVKAMSLDPYQVDEVHGPAPTTTRPSRACTPPPRTSSAPRWRPRKTGLVRRAPARRQHHRRAAPRHAGQGERLRIYNDIAVAIRWLLDNGAERVAYVDVDVHHGDGVENYDDPRVLTVSLHETGQMLFPGTGFPPTPAAPTRRAAPSTWRCRPGRPTPAGSAPSTPSCRRWCGSSSPTCWSPSTVDHIDDPLAHLSLTVDGQRAAYLALHDLAQGLRRPVVTGGGYSVVDVVPRAWTHLLAIVGGSPLDPHTETPDDWREHVRTLLGRTAPFRLTDGVRRRTATGPRATTSTWLDRAIHATREAAFPPNGLDYLPRVGSGGVLHSTRRRYVKVVRKSPLPHGSL